MASRRPPLAHLPNGANSPLRGPAAASKRARANSGLEDANHDQAPPLKRQAHELSVASARTPRKQAATGPTRRVDGGAAERRQQACKQRDNVAALGKQERVEEYAQSLDTIRQWQKHYRRVFPNFTFYFDNVPKDAKQDAVSDLRALGAREVLFFSRDVTHVITTRHIPPKSDRTTTSPGSSTQVTDSTSQHGEQDYRTINPSLLEKCADASRNNARGKFDFEASLGRRAASSASTQASNLRRPPVPQAGVLQKAKDMGMKLWQLEKLQRVLATILEGGEDQPHGHNTRSQAAGAAQVAKAPKELTLEDVLREDARRKNRDRDLPQCTEDVVPLKGPYIYVFDMNEKTKPIMVREYHKVERREDGDWPQFRSASKFKCPFIEDPEPYYQSTERPKPEERIMDTRSKRKASMAEEKESRRRETVQETDMKPPEKVPRRDPLEEMLSSANARPTRPTQQRLPPQPACFGGAQPFPVAEAREQCFAPPARGTFVQGNEPMASGLQASNITSAIRSQVVSSTAAAPGAKAGTSREIHGLQRKVLERNSGPMLNGLGAVTASSRPVAPAAAMPAPERGVRSNPRAAKQKAQEKIGGVGAGNLAQIYEDPDSEDEARQQAVLEQPPKREKAAKPVKRDPKPGYCENCREKFDDFEEHTYTRKHVRFARDKANWKELDELLSQLVRPGRYDDDSA